MEEKDVSHHKIFSNRILIFNLIHVKNSMINSEVNYV